MKILKSGALRENSSKTSFNRGIQNKMSTISNNTKEYFTLFEENNTKDR